MEKALLEAKLSQLRQRLPGLLEKYSNESEFYPAFVREAEYITSGAPSDLLAWVETEIAKLLAEFGHVEGPP